MSRLSYGLRKMNAGTIGGQSRVASPRSPRPLKAASVVPTPVETVPGCEPTGWLQTIAVNNVDVSGYSTAFDPDPNYVWLSDQGLDGAGVWKHHFASLTPVSSDVADKFFPNPGGDYYLNAIAADSTEFIYTLGNDIPSTRDKLWQWQFSDPTWSGSLLWQSEDLDASWPQPAMVYSPTDDRIYFRASTDIGSQIRYDVRWVTPDGGHHPDQQGDEREVWSAVVNAAHLSGDMIRTSDDRIIWSAPAYPTTDVGTLLSYDISTETIYTREFNSGPGGGVLHMAHSPTDPTRIVVCDQWDTSYWELPSDLSTITEVTYTELQSVASGIILPRGSSLSQNNSRSVFQAADPLASNQGWWYRAEYCT